MRARSGAAGSGFAAGSTAGSAADGGSRPAAPAGAAARPLAAADRNAGPVRAGRGRGHGRRHDDRGLGAGARGSVRTADHAGADARGRQHARLIRPGFARGHRARDAATRARVYAAAEHAARDHDPAAEFQRAAEPDDISEPEHIVIDKQHSAGTGAGFLRARVAGRLVTIFSTPAGIRGSRRRG